MVVMFKRDGTGGVLGDVEALTMKAKKPMRTEIVRRMVGYTLG